MNKSNKLNKLNKKTKKNVKGRKIKNVKKTYHKKNNDPSEEVYGIENILTKIKELKENNYIFEIKISANFYEPNIMFHLTQLEKLDKNEILKISENLMKQIPYYSDNNVTASISYGTM
jgi:hypothetical protein